MIIITFDMNFQMSMKIKNLAKYLPVEARVTFPLPFPGSKLEHFNNILLLFEMSNIRSHSVLSHAQ